MSDRHEAMAQREHCGVQEVIAELSAGERLCLEKMSTSCSLPFPQIVTGSAEPRACASLQRGVATPDRIPISSRLRRHLKEADKIVRAPLDAHGRHSKLGFRRRSRRCRDRLIRFRSGTAPEPKPHGQTDDHEEGNEKDDTAAGGTGVFRIGEIVHGDEGLRLAVDGRGWQLMAVVGNGLQW